MLIDVIGYVCVLDRRVVVAEGTHIIDPTPGAPDMTSQRGEAMGALLAFNYAIQLVSGAERISLHIDNQHVVGNWTKLDDKDAAMWKSDPDRELYEQMLSLKSSFPGSLTVAHVKVSRSLR